MGISQYKRNFSVYFSNTANQHLVITGPSLIHSLAGKQEENEMKFIGDKK